MRKGQLAWCFSIVGREHDLVGSDMIHPTSVHSIIDWLDKDGNTQEKWDEDVRMSVEEWECLSANMKSMYGL